MKEVKIYTLYDGPRGPSPKSVYYGRFSKTIYHTAAVSIKQAVYLTAKNIWYEGNTGIIEEAPHNMRCEERMWRDCNGNHSAYPLTNCGKTKTMTKKLKKQLDMEEIEEKFPSDA